ncbi:hypothetical protein OBBRIDRAFT_884607 [Obba rivulosa]|uniref:Uncharacterized protein n=1 Tax=Obba rivulosa TaxID=1052685 RepID=A0A8E2DRQ3_9APHY|nr:hypothetical protein OBBRIDRAFT_884607 [Obba rivulosa]
MYLANEASLNALYIVRMALYLLILPTSEKLSVDSESYSSRFTDPDFHSSRFTFSDVALQMSRYTIMCAEAYPKLETCAKIWEEVAMLASEFYPFTACFVARWHLNFADALNLWPRLGDEVKIEVSDYANLMAVLRSELGVEAVILRCKAYVESPDFDMRSSLDLERVPWERSYKSWASCLLNAATYNDFMVLRVGVPSMHALNFVLEARFRKP